MGRIGSRDQSGVGQITEQRASGGEDEAGDAFFVQKDQQDEAGEGDDGQQDCAGVDDERPCRAGGGSAVEVVHNGEGAGGGFGDVVAVGVAVEEGVGGVTGAFEGDLDLMVVDAEIGEGSAEVVGLTEMVDDHGFIGVAGGGTEPLVRHVAGDLRDFLVAGEGVGVVEGEAGDGEE